MNLDGVLHGAKLYAEKQSIESGGSGGLVINTASLAGILYGMDKNRWSCLESDDRKANSPIMIIGQFHQIFSSISYQISKHGVVAMTRSFGHPKVVKKTGIKVAHHHHHHHHGKSNHQEKWSGLRLDWYHDCVESFSWTSDDQIKSHNHLHQYFAQHIAICPWFADTGILDGIDKTRLQKQVSIHYDNDHLLIINSIQ